jgi:hypothetical protein
MNAVLRLAPLALAAAPLTAAAAGTPTGSLRQPPVFVDFPDAAACEASIAAIAAADLAEDAAAPPDRWASIQRSGPARDEGGRLAYWIARTVRVQAPDVVVLTDHISEYSCDGARRSFVRDGSQSMSAAPSPPPDERR